MGIARPQRWFGHRKTKVEAWQFGNASMRFAKLQIFFCVCTLKIVESSSCRILDSHAGEPPSPLPAATVPKSHVFRFTWKIVAFHVHSKTEGKERPQVKHTAFDCS